VSLQPFGAVLHGKSSHWKIRGASVALCLEVVDGVLRVKSGAGHDDSDALAAAKKTPSA